MTIFAFTLPLPFLPPAPPLGTLFGLGTAVLLSGLMLFNAPLWLPALQRQAKAWLADGGEGGAASRLATSPK